MEPRIKGTYIEQIGVRDGSARYRLLNGRTVLPVVPVFHIGNIGLRLYPGGQQQPNYQIDKSFHFHIIQI